MENLIAVVGVWIVVSIPASLVIARLLSATNPDAKTPRTSSISFKRVTTDIDRGQDNVVASSPDAR
jgi:hypothetical protein